MKYTSEIDCATNICTVRITGKYFRPKDSEELKHLAVNTYTEHGCNLFLFDMTQAEIIMGGDNSYILRSKSTG